MGSFSASIPITVLGHYYPSLDAACLSYEISRANCLKKAKGLVWVMNSILSKSINMNGG